MIKSLNENLQVSFSCSSFGYKKLKKLPSRLPPTIGVLVRKAANGINIMLLFYLGLSTSTYLDANPVDEVARAGDAFICGFLTIDNGQRRRSLIYGRIMNMLFGVYVLCSVLSSASSSYDLYLG